VTALTEIAAVIDRINQNLGRAVAWLTAVMVVVQFAVVLMHYVFGVGSIFAQESIVYMHAVLFLAAAGYTLLRDGHVRVDIFYSGANTQTKAFIDCVGAVCFLIPVCILVWWSSWPYVAASWAVFEGSRETSGIQGVFLLKSFILVFAATLGAQGLSLAVNSGLTLLGHPPPAREKHADGTV